MYKFLFLVLSIILSTVSSISQSEDEFIDKFVREYNPDGYSGYQSVQNIQKRGLKLVSSLKEGLEKNQGLINSYDPSAILADFNKKIKDIENLEAQYKQSTNSYDFNAGQSIGDNFNNGNYDQGMNEFFGYLGSLEGRKQAERQAAAQKEALRRERDSKMTNAYWKAVDFNNKQILEYARAAAFSESIPEEKYFISFIKNLECFGESMESKFTTTSTYWLNNSCKVPIENKATGIENTFVAKDVQYLNNAKRKYALFEEMDYEPFRDAAIAYTAAVASKTPSAKLFAQIGDYYIGKSNILALTNYLTAETYDKNYFTGTRKQQFKRVKAKSALEIKEALEWNNKEYLNAFLSYNLDKTIFIEGKSVLNYAIQLDQPDAVQIILNKYTKDKPQATVQDKLRKTIMMASVYSAPETIQRFAELGVPVDFTMKGYRPVEVAKKSIAVSVFDYYVKSLDDGPEILAKAKSENADILNCKKIYLLIGQTREKTKQEVREWNRLKGLVGEEKFKEELVKSVGLEKYENAVVMISNLDKSNEELGNEVVNMYSNLKTKQGKTRVVEVLVVEESDVSYQMLIDIVEREPHQEKLISKEKAVHDVYLDEKFWKEASASAEKDLAKRYIIDQKMTRHTIEAVHKVIDVKEVPMLIACGRRGKFGFVNRKGVEVIPFIYDEVEIFNNGLARVLKKGKYGFINLKGEVVIPIKYNFVSSFYAGLAIVVTAAENCYSINKKGEKVNDIPKVVHVFEEVSSNAIIVQKSDGLNYLYDRSGKELNDKPFYFTNTSSTGFFVDDKLITVSDVKTGKFGCLNHSGDLVIPTVHTNMISPSFGVVGVEKNGMWAFIDHNNVRLTEYEFDEVYTLFDAFGQCIVGYEGSQIYIDTNGNEDGNRYYTGSTYILSNVGSQSKFFWSGENKKTTTYTFSELTGGLDVHSVSYKKPRYVFKDNGILINNFEYEKVIGLSFDHIKLDLNGKTFYINIAGEIINE